MELFSPLIVQSTVVALLLLLLKYCISSVVVLRQRTRLQLPPGPLAWPVLGSLHHLLGAVPHRSLAKLAHRYGPFMYMQLGSMPTVVVSSPELAREFLASHDQIFASRPYSISGCRLNYGQDAGIALRSYDARWRELRRLYAMQLFTARRLNVFKPMIMQEVREMMGEIRGYAAAGAAYDLTRGVATLMENIVCRLLMGKMLAEVSSMCNVQGKKSLKQVLHQGAVLFATPLVADFIPWLRFLDAKATRQIDAWHTAVDTLLDDVVTTRENALQLAAATPPAQSPVHNDFLDVLLSNHHLSRDQIKGILLELLVAGIDSSSSTLDWAMAELLQNQAVLSKLEEEGKRVVGEGNTNMVEEEDLPYTKAIVKETLRLHPPLPLLLPHISTKCCETGGYKLPERTRLLVNVWAIGRDPRVWADKADTFWPERFLGAGAGCEQQQQVDVRGQHFQLLPFGAGRRSCPAMSLALYLVETTLANLVHSFHWSLPPPPNHVVDMSEKLEAVMSRAHPLMAIPCLRQPN